MLQNFLIWHHKWIKAFSINFFSWTKKILKDWEIVSRILFRKKKSTDNLTFDKFTRLSLSVLWSLICCKSFACKVIFSGWSVLRLSHDSRLQWTVRSWWTSYCTNRVYDDGHIIMDDYSQDTSLCLTPDHGKIFKYISMLML